MRDNDNRIATSWSNSNEKQKQQCSAQGGRKALAHCSGLGTAMLSVVDHERYTDAHPKAMDMQYSLHTKSNIYDVI